MNEIEILDRLDEIISLIRQELDRQKTVRVNVKMPIDNARL